MSLNISTASLRSLIALTEKREKLTAELASVENQIAAAIGGGASTNPAPKVRKGRAKAVKKRGKRGAVKELILAGLKEAGEAGIAVKHLAAKIGIKPQNIHVWLHTTGKKSGLIKALGKGVYGLEESLAVESAKIEAPKPKAKRKSSQNFQKIKTKKSA